MSLPYLLTLTFAGGFTTGALFVKWRNRKLSSAIAELEARKNSLAQAIREQPVQKEK